jgi:NapC/NirT cytochrome c family, N-terminal region
VTRRILPAAFYNPISLVGAVIAACNAALIVFLSILVMLSEHPAPYADLIIFLLLPAVLLAGIALIVVGAVRERRRLRAGMAERRLPVIDLNDPRQRTATIALAAGAAVLTLLYAFTGYQAYEFTESTTFCGSVCHTVMQPEATAHAFSLHGEVGCADCHVGPGARYFVETKLSGVRQLFGVLTNRYPRPIPVPIDNLRPAQDTCEGCHGPQYQLSDRLDMRKAFLGDDKNTEWNVDLLLRMGEPRVERATPPKIHWHSSTTVSIEYATKDPKRVEIPWIRVVRLDGIERIYRSTDGALTDAELAAVPKRVMDCIDCHNRTGHYYRPPSESLDILLGRKLVDPALPAIKKVAVDALDGEYETRAAGRRQIREKIETFYREKQPEAGAAMEPQIEAAITAVQGVYERNFDPHMKVSWRNFPDHAGHMYSPGCFRCHDGQHKADDGTVLSKDCNVCHLLVEHQTRKDKKSAVFRVMDYPHPVDVGDAYREMSCSDCHG